MSREVSRFLSMMLELYPVWLGLGPVASSECSMNTIFFDSDSSVEHLRNTAIADDY